MHRARRAKALLPALLLVLAACADPDTGGQPTEAGADPTESPTESPAVSPAPPESPATSPGAADEAPRVDIGAFAEDPSAFTEGPIRILGRVDEVISDGESFYTSPAASEEGRVLVVLAEDAQVDKEIVEGSVLWLSGIVVPAEESELENAGAVTADVGDYAGDHALVAQRIGDPLDSDA